MITTHATHLQDIPPHVLTHLIQITAHHAAQGWQARADTGRDPSRSLGVLSEPAILADFTAVCALAGALIGSAADSDTCESLAADLLRQDTAPTAQDVMTLVEAYTAAAQEAAHRDHR